ncbi:MAG: rod shape-determining protein MreD [Rhodospirillales bacterium]|nr:rod shape-determining protein MreD [Rhodospirillales bacterium]
MALLVVGAIPMQLPGLQVVAPSLPLISVFYWSLHRPDLMPAIAAFILGLVHDVLSGAPLGTGAAVYLTVHAVVHWQRQFFHGKSFGVLWLSFSIIVGAAMILGWMLTSILAGTLVDMRAAALQTMATIGCFPLMVWALWRFHLNVLRQA